MLIFTLTVTLKTRADSQTTPENALTQRQHPVGRRQWRQDVSKGHPGDAKCVTENPGDGGIMGIRKLAGRGQNFFDVYV